MRHHINYTLTICSQCACANCAEYRAGKQPLSYIYTRTSGRTEQEAVEKVREHARACLQDCHAQSVMATNDDTGARIFEPSH